MAETLTTNWVGLVALIVALVVAGVLIYLYQKGKTKTSDLTGIATMIDKMSDVLENFGLGDSVVNILAEYAAKAVRVVEQMVKNGDLEKDNQLRKEAAKMVVEQLAFSDGLGLDIVYDNSETLDHLIEAAVNEMQSSAVKIELGVEETEIPSEPNV